MRTAVKEMLSRELRRRERASLERTGDIIRAYDAKPVLDPRTPEEMLYDERGLPS